MYMCIYIYIMKSYMFSDFTIQFGIIKVVPKKKKSKLKKVH